MAHKPLSMILKHVLLTFFTIIVLYAIPNRYAHSLDLQAQIGKLKSGAEIEKYLLGHQSIQDGDDVKAFIDSTANTLLAGKAEQDRVDLYLEIVRCEALFDRKYDDLSRRYRDATSSLLGRIQKSLELEDLVAPLLRMFEESPQPLKGVAGQKLYFLNLRSATDLLEPMILDNLENPDGKEIQTLFDFRGGDLILSMARLTGAATESIRMDERNLRGINREKGRLSMAEARLKGWKPKEEVLKIISDYALDDRWWVRRWAVEVMKDSPPHCRPELLSKLQTDPHPIVREAALEVKCATSAE